MDELDDEIDRELGIPSARTSPHAWLRQNGFGHMISQPSTTKRPPLDFLESLVLSGVRDVSARYVDQPDVSLLETFQTISAGLRKNYRGRNFEFDFSIFEKTAESISVGKRRWVAMRRPTNRRLASTIRLTAEGARLAAALPAVGTPLEQINVERCRAVITKPRPPHWKAKQSEKPEQPRGFTVDEVTYKIARAMLDALKAMQAKKDPKNPGNP